MATVFFMQPLGQIAGNLVSLIVIAASKSQEHETVDVTRSVDSMWRWVIGIGVIPGVIATLFRFAIPESPRFLMEIEDDPVQAEFDATTLFNQPPDTPASPGGFDTLSFNELPLPSLSAAGHSDRGSGSQAEIMQPATLNSHWRLTRSDIKQYFWTEGNWRTLAATSSAWLLMDFGFYGISLSSPQFLAKTWGSLHLKGPAPPWQTDDRPGADIYQMFLDSSVHGLVILNIGSFCGCLLLILAVGKVDRVGLQKWAFLALAALFIALGTMFITVHHDGPVAVVLYIIGQILFNFGSLPPPTTPSIQHTNSRQAPTQQPTSSPPKSSQPATAPPATASAPVPANSAPSSSRSSPSTTASALSPATNPPSATATSSSSSAHA